MSYKQSFVFMMLGCL